MYDDSVWSLLKDGKIPADLLLLKSTDDNGICGLKFAIISTSLLCLKMIIVPSECEVCQCTHIKLLLIIIIVPIPGCITYYESNFVSTKGTCFVRTDQLDGETDWKLKVVPKQCLDKLTTDQVSSRIECVRPHITTYTSCRMYCQRASLLL